MCALAPSGALAQPTPEPDLAAAHASLERGYALYGQKRYTEAAEAFRRAEAIAPNPINLYNIALCYHGAGRAREAIAAYRRVVSHDPDAGRISRSRQAIDLLMGSFHLTCTPVGATVELRERPDRSGQCPRWVAELEPGDYHVVVRAPGHVSRDLRLQIEPGRRLKRDIALPRLEAPPTPSDPFPWRYVAMGLTTAAAGVGAYYGLEAISAISAVDDRDADDTPDGRQSAQSRAEDAAWVSTAAWGVAGAAAAGTAVLCWLHASDPRQPARRAQRGDAPVGGAAPQSNGRDSCFGRRFSGHWACTHRIFR